MCIVYFKIMICAIYSFIDPIKNFLQFFSSNFLITQVPIFSKREDMFLTLCEYSVPMLRATWFIKMTSAYHESKVAESKIKKRQQPDIAQGKLLHL